MRTTSAHAVSAAVLAVLIAVPAAALEWTGRVVDARTGEPVADVPLRAGRAGKANVARGSSGADGSFRIAYPSSYDEDPAKYDRYTFQAREAGRVPDDEWVTVKGDVGEALYLEYEEHRPRPAAVGDVRLVPQFAFITGRVVDADTGAPLAGISVRLRRPGKWLQEAVTDAEGVYRMRAPAYTGSRALCVETTPEAFRPEGRYKERQGDYGLAANWKQTGPGADYEEVDTSKLDVSVPVLSSVTPALVTRVDIRVPKAGAPVGADLVSVTPPGQEATAGAPDLKALARQLNLLIAQHRQAVMKARSDGQIPACNQKLLGEMTQIRKALQSLGGKARGSYEAGAM